MGVWEHEGHYTKFKTLGAKRYLIEENKSYHLTVAGLSKKNGIEYMVEKGNNNSNEIFKLFNDELYIPEERTGKLTHTYIDTPYSTLVTDYNGVTNEAHAETGIHLGGCEFTLSISKQYKNFLNMLKLGYIYKGVKHV